MPPSEPEQRQLGKYFAMAQVGLEMVAPIAIGWWADQQLASEPWLMVAGVILGFTLGLWRLIAFSNQPPADKPK